jgi:hypothetical protein
MSDPIRERLIRLMRDDYFGSVMREDYPGAASCFTDDSHITIFHGDNPKRRFTKLPEEGPTSYRHFWGHIFDNYRARFTDFRFVVDLPESCAAATFLVTMDPKLTSAYRETGVLTLNNCNFFWFRDGLISEMIIYYANPTLGARLGLKAGAPTAFPQA